MFDFRSTGLLERLAARLDEAPRRVHEDVARQLEAGVREALDQQFATGTDPYGAHWVPPKDGHSPPMVRTGRLCAGLSVHAKSAPDGATVTVTSDAPYAAYLQSGTGRMEARRIVPGAGFAGAPGWSSLARSAYAEAVHRWFGLPQFT